MIFLVLLGKIIFPFSENMILPLDGKWKMIFLKKKYTEKWYFLQMFRKDGLFKKDCAWTWYFLYYLERWYLFPENMIFFPLRDLFSFFPFSRNTWRHNIFCVHVNVLRTWCQVSLPKTPKMILFLKKDQKVTEILDWNSTKGSSKTLYLHRDLYRRFDILLSSEKKKQTENLIGISLNWNFIEIGISLLLQFIWLEIFYNE